MIPAISFRKIGKMFDNTELYKDFTLDIELGHITVLFGPNGSGKSTLLNIASGILPPDSGHVDVDPDSCTSYIFQRYAESLLPWYTNYDNLVLPLRLKHISEHEIHSKATELKNLFHFTGHWNDYPYTLSGGQKQILAFMRAVITEPGLLYIDEPFSALDYENNLHLREYIQMYFLTYKPTIVLVTHSIEEAVHLGKTILVLSKNPTNVHSIIQNTLPYPRTLQSLQSEQFHKTKDRVLQAFQGSLAL